MLAFIGTVICIAMLPFMDLVLASTINIVAIAWNTFLSVKCLGEELHWKYDLPAFTLMGAGTIIIVMTSSKTEKQFTLDDIKEMLNSNQSLYFYAFSLIIVTVSIAYFKFFEK